MASRPLGSAPLPLLLQLLLLGVAALASGKTPPPLHADCPTWLTDYIIWHRENKFNPDAKYLMYDCQDGTCQGLADRLRGILWLLRTAAHSKRVLLIRMTIPVPIERFFEPTHIDWTVPMAGGPGNQTIDVPRHSLFGLEVLGGEELMDGLPNRTEKWLGGRTNQFEDFPQPKQPALEQFSRAAACAMQALYQPTEAVERVVAEQFAEMQIDPAQPYIALHLRTFQMVGEGEFRKYELADEERILTSVLCAREMAPACNVDLAKNPAVLVTDGLIMRRRVSQRLYSQLTTAHIQPYHFDNNNNNPAATGPNDRHHLETIADFIVLSRASGLYYDRNSGFSRMAAYLGGHVEPHTNPCIRENHECAKFAADLDYKHAPAHRAVKAGRTGRTAM